jgi:hypothetical protein
VSEDISETAQVASDDPSSANDDAAQDETPRLVDRIVDWILRWARPLLALFGFGGFIVGIIVAWRAESATALLIVSAVLTVLAVFGLDWSEIRGTYGGWTVQMFRYVEERIGKVAASDEASPAIREDLESLRAEVEALRPRKRSVPLQPWPPFGSEGWRDLFRTKATHAFRGTHAVQLTLRAPGITPQRYRCRVKTPTGATYDALTKQQIIAVTGFTTPYEIVYPDEFAGSEPLTPGRYEVEWRVAPFIDVMDPAATIYAVGLNLTQVPAATDSFTIPATDVAEPEPPVAG